jgi:hypothetical protein
MRGPAPVPPHPMGRSSPLTADAPPAMRVAKAKAIETVGKVTAKRKERVKVVPGRVVARQHGGTLKIVQPKKRGRPFGRKLSPDEQVVHRQVTQIFNNVLEKPARDEQIIHRQVTQIFNNVLENAGEKPRYIADALQVSDAAGKPKGRKNAELDAGGVGRNGDGTQNLNGVARHPGARPPSVARGRPRQPRKPR